ncbi:50S ribosomal protein L29 [bacterium]|jgi:large subunit ribosomal protein L29|nr:50S ribosomal protein L29 [bacterium]MBT4251544.1 50S ribosomal protein L29 [bacterium]MBT4597806.1 50S ribosomal protein L29 [bacterium]MBT6753530.1 50S ribosomal protein L29 [bacterium]MBT7037742.1 50S ribosomal protein L29 [bacterium]
MKAKEIREKSKEELETILKDSRAKLMQARFDLTSRQLRDSSDVKKTKKDIARILTILHNK